MRALYHFRGTSLKRPQRSMEVFDVAAQTITYGTAVIAVSRGRLSGLYLRLQLGCSEPGSASVLTLGNEDVGLERNNDPLIVDVVMEHLLNVFEKCLSDISIQGTQGTSQW